MKNSNNQVIKKKKSLVIYSIGGIVLLVFSYGLTVLRSINTAKQQVSRTSDPAAIDHF